MMETERKARLPYLAAPAMAVLPAVAIRLAGWTPGTAVQYLCAGIAIALGIGLPAAGRFLPLLKYVPVREHAPGGAAIAIAGLAAGVGTAMGFDSAGFAALGAAGVVVMDSSGARASARALAVIGALFYATVCAAAAAQVANAGLSGCLWRAGASGWLAALGAAVACNVKVRDAARLPAASILAGLLALGSGTYFERVGLMGLSDSTYAVGVAVNLALAWLALAVEAADLRGGVVLGGLGSLVYATHGMAGYSAYLVAVLIGGAGYLLVRSKDERPAWKALEAAAETLPGTALLVAHFVASDYKPLLLMGLAAFAGAAAVNAGRLVGTKWGKSFHTVLPWRSVPVRTRGSMSREGIVGAAVGAVIAALLPLAIGVSARYGLGWSIVAAMSGLVGALLRNILCGSGVIPKGAWSKASGPMMSALAALGAVAIHNYLFPK